MRAAFRSTYGTSEVLSIKEVEKPTLDQNELLIRVYAATVNRTDCHVLWGKPNFMRLFTGLFKPKLNITGTDFAGQVEATGKNVKSFKPGDRVMGFEFFGLQSHAHYLKLPETEKIVIIPGSLSYYQAAACIEGGFYALSVINKMNPKSGQKALVIGATGAIGSAMVQFFKYYECSVTAVCGKENSDLVKSLGASKIIDYKTDDFTKEEMKYDFVCDAVGKSTFTKCKPVLEKTGIYSSAGGPNFLRIITTKISGGKKEIFAPPKDQNQSLNFIAELAAKGDFKPVIDRKYPLDEIAKAFDYVASGKKIGNVIITLDS